MIMETHLGMSSSRIDSSKMYSKWEVYPME